MVGGPIAWVLAGLAAVAGVLARLVTARRGPRARATELFHAAGRRLRIAVAHWSVPMSASKTGAATGRGDIIYSTLAACWPTWAAPSR
jgi:hypothetical protein